LEDSQNSENRQIPQNPLETLKNEILRKVEGKTFVTLSASVTRQIMDFVSNTYSEKPGVNCTIQNYTFWNQTMNEGCERDLALRQNPGNLQPRLTTCVNTINNKITKFYFFPHGRPLFHGGCSQRSPWMFDTLKKLRENEDLSKNITLILGPGPHFTLSNPMYFYNRLAELKPEIYKLKRDFPGTNIIFKTPNYLRGNLVLQTAVLSAYSGFRLREIILNLFPDREVVRLADVWEQTESAWNFMASCDVAGCNTGSIHPGTGTSSKFLFNEVTKATVDEFLD
jgi:hypothetical protein